MMKPGEKTYDDLTAKVWQNEKEIVTMKTGKRYYICNFYIFKIFGNPPYMKIAKNAPEALAMSDICHGAPNLYFLFASMSMFNLKDD